MNFDQDLNPQQLEAVKHTEGPLLIFAGAGSGKTRVITYRVAYLLAKGIPGRNILGLTFTNKAAETMRTRVNRLAGGAARDVFLGTFHAFAATLLRAEIGRLGWPSSFSIYDEDDQKTVLKECITEAHLDDKQYRPGMLAYRISRAKDDLIDPDSYAIYAAAGKAGYDLPIADVYARYQQHLHRNHALDFGDLLMDTETLFRDHADLLEKYQDRFRYILVDEYQDTNHAQHMMIRRLAAKYRNLCVVGDDDQCLAPGTQVLTGSGTRPIEALNGAPLMGGCGFGEARALASGRARARHHAGPMVAVTLRSGRTVRCTPNHICFARLAPSPRFWDVYLMYREGKGYRIGVAKGGGLRVRANAEGADKMWIVRRCAGRAEASFWEQMLAARYGLPTTVFHVRGRRMALTQPFVDRIYREVDTETRAARLMEDFLLVEEYPHHRPDAVVRGGKVRRHVRLVAFGSSRVRQRALWRAHRIALNTSGEALRERLARRFPVRPGRRGTWRVETERTGYLEAVEYAKRVAGMAEDFELVSAARFTPGPPFLAQPASHLRPGMKVPIVVNGRVVSVTVAEVNISRYDGPVYDLEAAPLHNFVANGMLVHNSVYGWRGADIRNILSFEKDYPDTKIVKLEQNYRSTPQILEKAWRVVKHNQFRADKKLWTERPAGPPPIAREFPTDLEEAEAIAAEIRRLQEEQGLSLREVAVFYRTNAQSRLFEEALRRQNLAHVVVGSVRFYARAEIKDVVAYLRLIVNREDEFSLKRIINAPARGIGKTTLQDLARFAHDKQISLWDTLARVRELGIGPKTTGAIEKFRGMIVNLAEQKAALRPAVFAARVLETTGYVADLEAEGTWESEQRLENLQEFIAAVEEFEGREPGAGLEKFLEQVALMSGIDRWSTEAEAVTLMTVHLSKGLEFGTVFMVGMEEGLFPHGEANFSDEELEEERRLCYVGMTRAKDRLCLTSAQSRRLRGSSRWTLTSRFVEEAGLVVKTPRGGVGAASSPPAHSSVGADLQVGPPSSTPVPAPFSAGDRVVHPEFGGGVVTLVSGTGDDVKVTVQFDDGRWRKLMLRYASLTPES